MRKLAFALAVLLLATGCCKKDSGDTGDVPGASGEKPSAATVAASNPAATTAPATGAAPAAPGKLLGSCMIMGVACSDYYGTASVDMLKGVCKSVGKWSDGACPTAGIQGTCTKTEPGGIINKTHTYPPGTPATAKQACDNTPGGVFSGS